MKQKTRKPNWIRSNTPALIAFVSIIGGWFLFGDILIVMILAMFAGIFSIIGWATHNVVVKQRPRLSLSTALVLMLVASGFLWLNTRPSAIDSTPHMRITNDGKLFSAQAVHYGWPVHAFTYNTPINPGSSEGVSDPNIPAIMLNTVVALAFLVPLGYFCEKRLRQKHTNPSEDLACAKTPAARN